MIRILLSVVRNSPEENDLFDVVSMLGIMGFVGNNDPFFRDVVLNNGENDRDFWEKVSEVVHEVGGASIGTQRIPERPLVPTGWDMRNSVWPIVCMNMVKYGFDMYDLLKPTTVRWNNVKISSLNEIVTQGAFTDKCPDMSESMSHLLGMSCPTERMILDALSDGNEKLATDYMNKQLDCMWNLCIKYQNLGAENG